MNAVKNSRATVLAVHPGAELFGSDRMFLESVVGQVQAGFNVVVVLPVSGPLAQRLQQEGALVTIASMLVLRKSLMRPTGWPRLLRDALRNLGTGVRLMRRYRPVTLYVSTLTLPIWPLLGRLHKLRVVSHVHEAESTQSSLVQKAMYLPHLSATTVIVNSTFSADTLRASLPALAQKCQVVYNGVSAPANPPVPRTTLSDPIRVLYIGRLSPRKGPDVALEAVQLLRQEGIDVHLTLLGSAFDGYEWFEDDLRRAASTSDLSGGVEFVGFEENIWPRLASADVIVVPSIKDEPFGNTAVEGILARRPVIASDTSGLREAAGGYASALLVTPNDPEAISRALMVVRNDWEAISAATAQSARAAESKHGVPRYRESIAAICG